MSSGYIVFGFSGNPNEPAAMRGGSMSKFIFDMDTWLQQKNMREKFDLSFVSPAKKLGQYDYVKKQFRLYCAKWQPKQAHMANLQVATTTKNICRYLNDKTPIFHRLKALFEKDYIHTKHKSRQWIG